MNTTSHHRPVSGGQRSLWLLQATNPTDPAYNISGVFRVQGPLDIGAFREAVNLLSQRHDQLRTSYHLDGDDVRCTLHSRRDPVFRVHERPGAAPESLREEASRACLQPFNLATDPLFRLELFCMSSNDHLLACVVHHIVSDLWSTNLMLNDLLLLYEGVLAGRSANLASAAPYEKWAEKELGILSTRNALAWEEEWRQEAKKGLPLLRWPSTSQAVTEQYPPILRFTVPADRARTLRSVARRFQATPFQLFLAAFQYCLHDFTGQDDLLVGTPATLRNHRDFQNTVGYFINLLAVRSRRTAPGSFEDFFAKNKAAFTRSYARRALPFSRLVEIANPERRLGKTPLIQAVLAYQKAPSFDERNFLALAFQAEGYVFQAGPVTLKPFVVERQAPQFDLTLTLGDINGVLYGQFHHDPAVLSRRDMETFASQFESFLTELATPTLHAIVEERAHVSPDAVAIQEEGLALSYGELNRRAHALAGAIADLDQPGPIGLFMEGCMDAAVSMLAILKSGRAFVPIDPASPLPRILDILNDVRPAALIAAFDAPIPPELAHLHWIRPNASGSGSPLSASSSSLAYILYTSGSTGRPKGVCVPHRSIVCHALASSRAFGLTSEDRVLQFHTLSFDAALEELFPTWQAGGTVVMSPSLRHQSLKRVLEQVRADGVTVLNLPTSYWHLMVDELDHGTIALPPSVRLVVVGGEAAHPDHYRRWTVHAPKVAWINTYGVTEAAVSSLWTRPTAGEELTKSDEIPIGEPLPHVQAYVVDEGLKPVPQGQPGELCLGGRGLADGYHGLPELTKERFIQLPFAAPESGRVYRTGDIVLCRPDGQFVFLGRKDREIKRRGFRLHPLEIERNIATYPGVRDVFVETRPNGTEGPALIAHVTPAPGRAIRPAALRRYLQNRLPPQMIPDRWQVHARLPRAANGKIVAAHLKTPKENAASPRGDAALRKLFADVLGVPKVRAHDNFYQRGGHSLLTLKLIARINETFGTDLSPADVIAAPTPHLLAERLHPATATIPATMYRPPAPDLKETQLSLSQERIMALESIFPGRGLLNIPLLLDVHASLDKNRLEQALASLLKDYPLLGSSTKVRVAEVDFAKGTRLQRRHKAEEWARRQAVKPFLLDGHEPLLRLTILRLSAQRTLLLIVTHHMAADAWAFGRAVEKLSRLYGLPLPSAAAIPNPFENYSVYSRRQREWLQGPEAAIDLEYWKSLLSGPLPENPLPQLFHAQDRLDARSTQRVLHFSPNLTKRLRAFAARRKTTPFLVALAAFSTLLREYANGESVVMGTVLGNREDRFTREVLGPVQNAVLFKSALGNDYSFEKIVDASHEQMMEMQRHGRLPFERAARELWGTGLHALAAAFRLQFDSRDYPLAKTGFESSVVPIDLFTGQSGVDLTVGIRSSGKKAKVFFEYRQAVFAPETIAWLARHYETLLQRMLAHPTQPVRDLSFVSRQEQRLYKTVNHTAQDLPRELLQAGFERRAAGPGKGRCAVIDSRGSYTYEQLDKRANQLAHDLRAAGLKPGRRVAIVAKKGWETSVAVLGTLKAGGVYVPLDPSTPPSRAVKILRQSSARIVLSDPASKDTTWLRGRTVLVVDELAKGRAEGPRVSANPHRAAYVIFTSGSTGTPKGVEVAHAAVTNTIHDLIRRCRLNSRDRVLSVSSLMFDLSVFDLFGLWAVGGTVVFPDTCALPDPAAWANAVQTHHVTLWNSVPCLFQLVIDQNIQSLQGLRHIFLSGDKISPALARQIRKELPKTNVLAMGGATEASIWSILHRVVDVPADWRTVPYGRAMANQTMRVMNAKLQDCPIEVPGEICIGGDGLATGYCARPAETRQRFVRHPQTGLRLYRTGDRGRYLPSGEIEILGRLDHQVKIRGMRIELGEIECALRSCPGVRDSVVKDFRSPAGEPYLAAYLLSADGAPVSHQRLQSHLTGKLSPTAIPAKIYWLDAFPLTANGKVDRTQLQPGSHDNATPIPFEEPATPEEKKLAALWSGVLRVERIGRNDDFFALGGHSLAAVKLVHQIRTEFPSAHLTIADFVGVPTLQSIARRLTAVSGPAVDNVAVPIATLIDNVRLDDLRVPTASLNTAAPAASFLTGATGLVGAHLLRSLLRHHPDDVYCFIRGDAEVARRKIEQHLGAQGQSLDWNRVHWVSGNLHEPNLGLAADDAERIAQNTQRIFHVAADTHLLRSYEQLRTTNVEALRAIIHLAARGRLKELHYVSSVAVFPYARPGVILESERPPHEGVLLSGYAQSKWVAESLVWKAAAQGLPVTVYRPSQVVGGRAAAVEQLDLLKSLFYICQTVGAIPAVDAWADMVPADYVGEAIAHLAWAPSRAGQAFHLTHPQPRAWADLLQDIPAAKQWKRIAFEEWQSLVNQHVGREAELPFQLVQSFLNRLSKADLVPSNFDCAAAVSTLNGSGIICPTLDAAFADRYLG